MKRKLGKATTPGHKPRTVPSRKPVTSRTSKLKTDARRDRRVGGPTRLAAIDIGSNSVRLIVAETDGAGSYRVLDDEKEITRLGRGLHKSGKLHPETQEHSAVTIARMKSIAEGYGASRIRVVGTAACRDASNAEEFVALVRRRSGLEVEIIRPEQEALLAYRSAARAFDLTSTPAAVVDLGGGSLEIVLSAETGRSAARSKGPGGGVIERVYSLPLGAVRMTEQFGGPKHAAGKRFDELTRSARTQLKEAIGKLPFVPRLVIGTGGTFTTLASILMQRQPESAEAGQLPSSVQGREIRRSDVRHVLDYLRKLPLKERAGTPGLPADRADIIVAGLVVIDELFRALKVNTLHVHEGGIRDGLLLDMSGKDLRAAGKKAATDPIAGVKRFAKACNFEAAHASRVTRLALRLFDQLREQSAALHASKRRLGTLLEPRNRLLLEAAALLHDIGYLVNYASHHKHSYHLIVHAELPGFTRREVQVIANVARYHRAAEPKATHSNFSSLDTDDRLRVEALAAILRIADGFDRTHAQLVTDVRMQFQMRKLTIGVIATGEPAVDMWGAMRKSGLFERVFGTTLRLEWVLPESELGGKSSGLSRGRSGQSGPQSKTRQSVRKS